jgi:hypothetical protein
MRSQVEAFNLKGGPTESGEIPPSVVTDAVGGELLPFDIIKALPAHMIMILVLMVPLLILLYKKRDYAVNLIARLFF